jgi:hypothetical protein
LLDSIQVTSLVVSIATTKAQTDLRNQFDNCVNYLKPYIASTSSSDKRNVSAYGQGPDKRPGPMEKKTGDKRAIAKKQWKGTNHF